MDDLRQWWLHTARPVVYRVRWFAAGWLVLALVAVPWGLRAQERSLEGESRAALDATGVAVEDVSFTGRNAVVTGSLTATDRVRAERALAEVAGIRSIEWGVTLVASPPPSVTTTTTPPPKDQVASLELKVVAGRMVVRGVLPDAAAIADIGSVADRLYGPGVGNGLITGDVHPAAWSDAAAGVVQVLPMVGDATVTMDADGVAILAVATDDAAADAFTAAVADVLGPEVPVDVSVEVSAGRPPSVDIASADGTITVAGSLARRKSVIDLAAAVADVAGDAAVGGEMSVDKTLDDPYLVGRLPLLVDRLGSAETWSLRYRRGVLVGSVDGGGLFRRQTEPTARLEHVIEQLGALMVGNPSLRLTVEVGADASSDEMEDETSDATADESGDVDLMAAEVELARRRTFALVGALVRVGVDPDRVAASVATGGGELLRFRLEPAER